MGHYKYAIQDGSRKGLFNIYQAKNGGIYMVMGNSYTELTAKQVNELNISVYELHNFDKTLYEQHYFTLNQ